MSIYKYEEAIVTRMREITGDDRIIITPSNNMINIIPRIAKDELKLPLIHMIRNTWKLSSARPHGMKMNGNINNGFPMFRTDPEENIDVHGKINRLHAIPMVFSHTFEVWTKTREENDEMIRELIWFFSTIGTFHVEIPYGVNINHEFSLQLADEIIDNTDIVSHKDAGEIFVQAIITTCDDAYLWKSSQHNPTCVHIKAQVAGANEPVINQDYNKLTLEQKQLYNN